MLREEHETVPLPHVTFVFTTQGNYSAPVARGSVSGARSDVERSTNSCHVVVDLCLVETRAVVKTVVTIRCCSLGLMT